LGISSLIQLGIGDVIGFSIVVFWTFGVAGC